MQPFLYWYFGDDYQRFLWTGEHKNAVWFFPQQLIGISIVVLFLFMLQQIKQYVLFYFTFLFKNLYVLLLNANWLIAHRFNIVSVNSLVSAHVSNKRLLRLVLMKKFNEFK